MNERWQQIQLWYTEQASDRRLLIAIALWVLFALPLISYGVLPLLDQQQKQHQQISSVEQTISSLRTTVDSLTNELSNDVDKPLLEEIERKRRRMASLEERAEQYRLMDKNERRAFFQSGLSYPDSMKLVSLESQPPKSIAGEGSAVLYQHQINAVYQGNFTDTQTFFQQLREQNPEVVWHRFDYTVVSYPRAEVVVQWHLMSSDKEIIGG